MRVAWVLVAACVTVAAGCSIGDSGDAVKPVYNARTVTAPDNAAALAEQVIAIVNDVRTQHGLKPLIKSNALMQLAESYAANMINEGFFDHVDPATGDGPLKRALQSGYLCLSIGENLAAGQTSPARVVDDWMASTEGHRENILSVQWDEVGAAVRTGGEYGIYWVIEFANRP